MTRSEPTSGTPPQALTDDDAGTQSRQTYDQLLSDAIKAVTAAARLRWTLRAPDGSAATRPCDWAEFVTLVLAGATANIGSLEAILAGRPGSWEADGVRNLLTGTVGYDEQQLIEHRTEPVVVNINVDDIMFDREVWQAYDEAGTALQRRYDDLGGTSWTGSSSAVPEDLSPVTAEQEQELDELATLEYRLEQQRQQDWAAYGTALKTHIEAQFSLIDGLRVPVLVNVDSEVVPVNSDSGTWGSGVVEPVADRLLKAAIDVTSLPGQGRSPLERLTDHVD